MKALGGAIFWEIFHRRQLRRLDLVRSFAVSSPTVSRTVDSLIERGLLMEAPGRATARGRHPALLRVPPGIACFAGIEIDRARITAVVTGMTGNLLGRGALAYSPADTPDASRLCRSTLELALDDAAVPLAALDGVGIGCAAWARGGMSQSLSAEKLAGELGTEVSIDDRARASALAHHLLWPEFSAHADAIYVNVASGIGGGLFLGGRLYRGAGAAAGEVGHIVIDRNGPACACGNRGCVEAFASTGAILARYRGLCGNTVSTVPGMEQFLQSVRAGEPTAVRVLREAGEALGAGIANAVQLLNPSLVVLTGRFCRLAGNLLLEPVQRTVAERSLRSTARGLEIRLARVRKDVVPIGCALLAACDIGPRLIQLRMRASG